MASKIEEILGKSIDSVKALKAEIKSLQDSLVGLDAESQEFKDTSIKLAAAQDELTKVTRAGKEENIAAKDSVVGMEQEYKKLYNTYKMLSEEQRNSSFGKEMASQLETLSTKLNETKQGVGNFKDNIGRYASSVTEAFNKMGVSAGALSGPLKTATTGAKGFNTALKSLAANPVVLVITALVAILGKAAAAIKDNEELTNRLKEAMAVFKPVLDAVANAFDFLAGIIVKVVDGMSKVGEKILSIIPGYKEAAKSHKDLAKATNDLTKAQREASVENSKKQAEIERLREEASATDDVIEKKKLLEEAKALQNEVDQKNIELAQEELRIQQEYAEKTANSAEENEKLAAAQKKVNDAIATGERNMRQYNKQLDQVDNKTKSATSSGKNYREEAKKLYEQVVENSKTEIQKLTEKYEKEKKLLEKYHYDTRLLTIQYSKDVSKVRLDEWKKEQQLIKEAFSNYNTNVKRELQNYVSMAEDSVDAILREIENLVEAREELEKFKKDVDDILSGTTPALSQMLQVIFNVGDFTNLTDFKTIEDLLSTHLTDEDLFNGVFDQFYTFGEKSWSDFIEGFERAARNLKETYDIDIKTLLDIEPKLKQLGEEIAQKTGESVIENLNKYKKDWEQDIYEWFGEVYGVLGDFNFADNERLFEEERLLEGLKDAYEIELEDFKGTQEQKLEILKNYYDVVAELEQRHQDLSELNQQRTLEMVQSLGDATDSLGSVMGTMKSSYESLIDSELKAGKIDEKTANDRKKRLGELEKWEQRFAIATIAADAASGIFSIWKGYATEVGTVNPQTAAAAGPAAAGVLAGLNTKSLVSAIAKTASLAATATAQIMAARNGIVSASNNMSAMESGGSTDVGVGVTPALIDSQPYSYARVVQTEEDVDELNQRPIYVTVTDIENGIGQKVKVTDESSF